eukprot:2986925-Pyramimonas_sp.AAC.1
MSQLLDKARNSPPAPERAGNPSCPKAGAVETLPPPETSGAGQTLEARTLDAPTLAAADTKAEVRGGHANPENPKHPKYPKTLGL